MKPRTWIVWPMKESFLARHMLRQLITVLYTSGLIRSSNKRPLSVRLLPDSPEGTVRHGTQFTGVIPESDRWSHTDQSADRFNGGHE